MATMLDVVASKMLMCYFLNVVECLFFGADFSFVFVFIYAPEVVGCVKPKPNKEINL